MGCFSLQSNILNIVELVVGWLLVMTHVERAAFPLSFRHLLEREFCTDDASHHSVVINNENIRCHPQFRLILVSSVPLGFRGMLFYSFYLMNYLFQ